MKIKSIIVDLDGTLCDSDHRKHHVEKTPKDWDAFYGGMADDKIKRPILDLVICMARNGYKIIFLTGRPKQYETITKIWLRKNAIIDGCFLYMRAEGDFRPDHIVKEELYRKHIEPTSHVVFCVDDRKQVVDMWRRIGLTCLQCAEGNF